MVYVFYRGLVEVQNVHCINQHKQKSTTFKLAAKHFLSFTYEEFVAKMGSRINFPPQEDHLPSLWATILLTTNIVIDWWAAGKVSCVKDQGYDCGSCYTFATAGDIESSYLIKYGKEVRLIVVADSRLLYISRQPWLLDGVLPVQFKVCD
jgi:C1A family cysteine protease